MSKGRLSLDGIDVTTSTRTSLRSQLAFIPQSPDLFTGSLRENLDPLGIYDAKELHAVLQDARLGTLALDTRVDHGGENFSAGERQLLSLARAMLTSACCLVMDEAVRGRTILGYAGKAFIVKKVWHP